jgi:hypothetical protein
MAIRRRHDRERFGGLMDRIVVELRQHGFVPFTFRESESVNLTSLELDPAMPDLFPWRARLG